MPTRRLWTVLLLSSIAMGSVSCEDDPVRPPPPPDWALPIDSQIQITLAEVLFPSERRLHLQCQTAKEYGCINYRIETTVARGRTAIKISFGYIELSGDACFTAVGPAKSTIDLGVLSVGAYPLRLQTPNESVDGYLVVEAGAYRVLLDSEDAVSFTNPVLHRVPERTVWGLIRYGSLAGSPAVRAQAYLDSLEAHGAVDEPLEPGDYGFFTIDSALVMRWPPNLGSGDLAYHYRSTRDPTELREVVRQFAFSDSQWLSIQMHTWRGESWWSHLLRLEPQP
jgi:hypothetical protein